MLLSAVCLEQELFSTSGACCFPLLVTVHLVHKTVCSRLETLHATWLKKTSCVHLILHFFPFFHFSILLLFSCFHFLNFVSFFFVFFFFFCFFFCFFFLLFFFFRFTPLTLPSPPSRPGALRRPSLKHHRFFLRKS